MSVPHCQFCQQEGTSPSPQDLEQGDYCPLCQQPTCTRHLSIVRFRWRETRQVDSVRICRTCKGRYRHRYWDSAQRDWIS
jgi:hypothetical protein